jgi:hypothetical protein
MPLAVGPAPTYVVSADFNGDGIADLAVANSGDQTVTVLLGNGDGTFRKAPGQPAHVGINPVFMTVAELDGDHIPDLVVTNNGQLVTGGSTDPGSVSVLLGNGDGSFRQAPGSPIVLPGAHSPAGAAVTDFGGGTADLVVAYAGTSPLINPLSLDFGSVRILHDNGDGSFTQTANLGPAQVGRYPSGLVAQDLNGDHKPDLAVSNFVDGQVTVLLNDGAGGFTAAPGSPFATGNQPAFVTAADLNGDMPPDLVVVNTNQISGSPGGNRVTVLLNQTGQGGALFRAASFPTGAGPAAAVVGDLDADGTPDLAVTNLDDGTVTVLNGDGRGGFTPGATLAVGANPGGLALIDTNGDGAPDLVTANAGGTTLSLLLNQGGTVTRLSSTGDAVAGRPHDVTVTVTPTVPGGGTPAGTVMVKEGGLPLGDGSLDPSGQAVVHLRGLSPGNHVLTATCTPKVGSGFFPSTSPNFTLLVKPATRTVVSSSAGELDAGQPVTLTATVTAEPPATGTPAGMVTFLDGSQVLGSASLDGSGHARLPLPDGLPAGNHFITATYEGNDTFGDSTSDPISVLVDEPVTSPPPVVTPPPPAKPRHKPRRHPKHPKPPRHPKHPHHRHGGHK